MCFFRSYRFIAADWCFTGVTVCVVEQYYVNMSICFFCCSYHFIAAQLFDSMCVCVHSIILCVYTVLHISVYLGASVLHAGMAHVSAYFSCLISVCCCIIYFCFFIKLVCFWFIYLLTTKLWASRRHAIPPFLYCLRQLRVSRVGPRCVCEHVSSFDSRSTTDIYCGIVECGPYRSGRNVG